ncbi:Rho GTPase activating protein with PAK-box/P21-Rho-binding domain [Hibiscus syriacus]|uniref:Rho GTPase activating protein with PAK-box/P21-Rho-binding domain n=1 Tax=Hibiscus syriacus TaxID=106335 RepID=A0A6A3B3A5_HIBSY|nr:protein FAF-like, chloroplastic [Hibiscus syriacus]KAE8711460.1 Rho GTPase activating protein with PAK-box/P21-Rho-binding domain [Hibiscus syriacus]
MAACGSIQHIFENLLPENPTLLESLSSWNQIKPVVQPAFTEIFGELHFNENVCVSQSCSCFKVLDSRNTRNGTNSHENYEKSEGFSWSSESLQLCTEGLGFESSGDVEDMKQDWENKTKTTAKHSTMENMYGGLKRSRGSGGGGFPPPISCIGKSGKPCVCFKSYRDDGRFVLKQVRVPTQEFLHACREDGRLKLQFVQPDDDDEVLEDEQLEEEDEQGTAQKHDS